MSEHARADAAEGIASDLDERFRWALAVVAQLQRANPLRTVYDVGAGSEQMKEPLQALGLRYTAFDAAPQRPTTLSWNLDDPCPVDGLADVVVLLEVVEHLNNPWQAMRHVAAAVRPGGFLVLSTPNPAWSESRFSLITKGVLTMFTQEDLDANHHVFTPWRHVIFRLLQDNGLAVVPCGLIDGGTRLSAAPLWGWKMPFRIVYRAAKRIVERVDKSAVGSLQGFVAQKPAC